MSWPTEKGEIRLLGGGGGPLAGNQKDRLEVLAMHVVPVDERAERGSLPLSIIEIQTTPLAPERCEVRATCHFEPARPLFMELLRAIGERWPESGLAQDWTARIQAIAAALRAGPSRYPSRPDSAWDALLRFPATVEDFEAWIHRPLAELIPDYPPPYDLIGENTKGQKRFDLGKHEYATRKEGTERAGEDGEDDFIHIFRYKASLWRAGYSPCEETPLAEFEYELQGRELEVGVWCSKAREDADFIPWFAALLCQLEARWPEAKKGIDAMCVLRAPQIAAGEALPAEGEAGKMVFETAAISISDDDLLGRLRATLPVLNEREAAIIGLKHQRAQKAPRVPTKLKDKQKWRRCWNLIRGQWGQGKTYEAIAKWLRLMHGNEGLNYAPDTLADIIRAGEAGLLE